MSHGVSSKTINFYTRIENRLAQAEYRLGKAAKMPLLPGIIKVLMGTIQAVVAFTVAFFSAIPAMCNADARFIFLRSIAHIGHGFGNIAAGVTEAIPAIGYIVAVGRDYKENEDKEDYTPKANFIRYKYQTLFTPQSITTPQEDLTNLKWKWNEKQLAFEVTCKDNWATREFVIRARKNSALAVQAFTAPPIIRHTIAPAPQTQLTKILESFEKDLSAKRAELNAIKHITVQNLQDNIDFVFMIGEVSIYFSPAKTLTIQLKKEHGFKEFLESHSNLNDALKNCASKYENSIIRSTKGMGEFKVDEAEIQSVIDTLYTINKS